MLNEFAYCPRLGYLEWVQGEFEENFFTEDGRFKHRRVDGANDTPPDPEDEDGPQTRRSIMLSGETCGLIAVIDLLETDGTTAVPVDYKRGQKPAIPEGVYEPEQVQLCAQGLILAENGFECDQGVIYFVDSKDRVLVRFDEALKKRTLELAAVFRTVAASGSIPPPLEDSPKCNRCSLVGICLPDETGMLSGNASTEVNREPRRLIPARDDALPVYVQAQGAFLGKSGDSIVIKEQGHKVGDTKLFETSQVNLMGNVQISTQTVQELCRRGIPLVYFSTGGWFYGMTTGPVHKNIELRLHQYRAANDPDRSLLLARRFVSTKIRNCRTMLRRNAHDLNREVLDQLKESVDSAGQSTTLASLLGVEGTAARIYFQSFSKMIKQPNMEDVFSFHGRNRRPPKDPVNALLSLACALIAKELTVVLSAVGFDPYLGFYHQPRYGRPSLALDLMEEFRPLVADSTVIGAINNGVVRPSDFVSFRQGVALKPSARKSFINAYERRMDQLIHHPIFGYQISYRRVLNVQARLLGRHLAGEIQEYPEFATR